MQNQMCYHYKGVVTNACFFSIHTPQRSYTVTVAIKLVHTSQAYHFIIIPLLVQEWTRWCLSMHQPIQSVLYNCRITNNIHYLATPSHHFIATIGMQPMHKATMWLQHWYTLLCTFSQPGISYALAFEKLLEMTQIISKEEDC